MAVKTSEKNAKEPNFRYVYGVDLAEEGSKDYSCWVKFKKYKNGNWKVIRVSIKEIK